jgi:hypothetical protein
MRLESEHATHQRAPLGLAGEALEHRLVPEVNAIEIAYGQRYRRQCGGRCAVGEQH